MKALTSAKHIEIQRYINKRMEKIGSKPLGKDQKKLLDRESAVLSSNRKPIYR
jgi:hypothetical protein